MKKIRFVFVITVFISLSIYIFFGCKDKDKFAPLIYLNGDNPDTAILESPYIDPSAVAEDNLDGTITSSMVIGHNIPKKWDAELGDSVTSKTGTYEVYYISTDKAGNQKMSVRTVYVKNWGWKYEVPYLVYRKKVLFNNDSVGCQYWKYYPYRTVQQKFSVTADKDTNMKISIPLGGEIKIKVAGYFVEASTNPLRIKIDQQDVWGIKGWDADSQIVDTARILYRVVGSNFSGSDHSASYVENQAPGHLKILIKYLIQQWLPPQPPTYPSWHWGSNITYTDTLNQRY